MPNRMNPKEKLILKVFFLLGILLAAGIDILISIGPLSALDSLSDPVYIFLIKAVCLAVQTLTTILVTTGFAYAFIRIRVTPWSSVIAGIFFGFLAGGLSFGLTNGIKFSMASPAGFSFSGPYIGMVPWWQVFAEAFPPSFAMGGAIGAGVGAVMGLILGLSLGYGMEDTSEE